jgi:hypothetical protein
MLIAIMRYEEDRRKKRRRQLGWKLLFKTALFGIPALLLFVLHGRFMGLGNLIGVLLGSVIVTVMVSRSQHNAAYLLAKHFEDVSIIGPLAEALEYRSRPVREAAAAALIRLLPRVQESDADLLTSEQRSNLHSALMNKNPELVLAVLNVFEVTGDATAIPNVQKLAAGLGVASENRRVLEAAQHTLLVLRQRAEAQRAPQTLLRAASVGTVGSEVLLRPAVGAGDTAGQVLLRPLSNGTEETY